MTGYYLFLDDERQPSAVTWVQLPNPKEWVVARTVQEFSKIIVERGPPEFVSFDHDLGDPVLSGYTAAILLQEEDVYEWGGKWNGQFAVHSMNPVGAENIRAVLNSYLLRKR